MRLQAGWLPHAVMALSIMVLAQVVRLREERSAPSHALHPFLPNYPMVTPTPAVLPLHGWLWCELQTAEACAKNTDAHLGFPFTSGFLLSLPLKAEVAAA